MELYDINKVLEVSKTLFSETYPDVECFILTGSQLEKEFVSVVSDIDILIIDSRLSGVSSAGMLYQGYKVDFTRVGLHSLNEVLIDSCYSSSNTIIDMIIKGIFISDKLELEANLKLYCKLLYQGTNINYFNESRGIRRSLIKLKKNFSKDLNEEQIPLTLADFLINISKAYLFFKENGKYGFDGYRRSKLLSKTVEGLEFLHTINKISQEYLSTKENKYILNEIDRFLNFSLLNTGKISDEKYILNVSFGGENSYLFYMKIVQNILKNEFLAQQFLYGQRVFKNAIFKYEYLLVFKNNNINQVLNQLLLLVHKTSIHFFKYETIDAFYISELVNDERLVNSSEVVLKQVNIAVVQLLETEKKFAYKKLIPLFIYIVEEIKMQTSTKMVQNLLSFLRLKYRQNSYYQELDHHSIDRMNIIFETIDTKFKEENKDIIETFKKLIIESNFSNQVENQLPSILELKSTISQLKECQLDDSNFISPFFSKIIRSYESDEIGKFYLYLNLLDNVLKTLAIKEGLYAVFLVVAQNAYSDD
ncbi:hypothetical protein [Myroides sp. TSA_177.3]|uniref:hypothetical protein n=1 Tax=Myroides sp. TSA_177.3 TaxID=3415650 RepID=UPI004045CA2B